MLDLMWEKNQDGGGAAWREPQTNGNPLVCWEKGLMKDAGLARMKELVKVLPIPFILHFRIATIGGVKPNMTHPFPIDVNGPNELSGKTSGFVLFHNGTLRDWDKEARMLAFHTGTRIPSGKWSDSRAIAWMCSVVGNGLMEWYPDQKGLAFGPMGSDIFTGTTGWDQVEDPVTDEKIWCSNNNFVSTPHNGFYTITPYCNGERSCFRKDVGKDGRCPNHPLITDHTQPKALPPAPGVSPIQIPFPPTPKDSDNPQGPILSLEVALRACVQGKIGKDFLGSVQRAHERMKKGGKDGDRAKRTLIICGAMPPFSGLQV